MLFTYSKLINGCPPHLGIKSNLHSHARRLSVMTDRCFSCLISYTHPLTCSVPAPLTFLFLKHANLVPAAGSLHWLFALPGTPLPISYDLLPFFIQLSFQMSSLRGSLFNLFYLHAACHFLYYLSPYLDLFLFIICHHLCLFIY